MLAWNQLLFVPPQNFLIYTPAFLRLCAHIVPASRDAKLCMRQFSFFPKWNGLKLSSQSSCLSFRLLPLEVNIANAIRRLIANLRGEILHWHLDTFPACFMITFLYKSTKHDPRYGSTNVITVMSTWEWKVVFSSKSP